MSHCIKSERCIFLDQEVADMANEDKKDQTDLLYNDTTQRAAIETR